MGDKIDFPFHISRLFTHHIVPELNFGSDELLSGKEISFLYIPLAVAADILFLKMLVLLLVLLSKVNLSSL